MAGWFKEFVQDCRETAPTIFKVWSIMGLVLLVAAIIALAGCCPNPDWTRGQSATTTATESKGTADASSVTGQEKILDHFEANVICVEGRKFVVFVGFRFGETVMTAVQIWDKNKFISAYPPQPEDCL